LPSLLSTSCVPVGQHQHVFKNGFGELLVCIRFIDGEQDIHPVARPDETREALDLVSLDGNGPGAGFQHRRDAPLGQGGGCQPGFEDRFPGSQRGYQDSADKIGRDLE
jgi:hypothetical protein